MTARWFTGDALAFDLETTHPEPEEARVVTASIVVVSPEGVTRRREWLVNPGVDIPAGATAVHGVTNEMAKRGLPPAEAIPDIATELLAAWAMGLPVVIFNASYDVTVMQRELARVGHEPMAVGHILDPFVIDRGVDAYRKGKRTLTAMAQHYGVRQDTAHSSAGDAITAARIVWRIAKRPSPISGHTLVQTQEWQRESHAARQSSYAEYLAKQGKPGVVDGSWPCR